MEKNCSVCSSHSGKYKCPTCFAFYCSVNCCKQHRDKGCTPKPKEDKTESNVGKNVFTTPDTVPVKRLEQLRENKDLKEMITNPHLQQLIQTVNQAADPDKTMAKVMQEPIFVEFANACLATISDND